MNDLGMNALYLETRAADLDRLAEQRRERLEALREARAARGRTPWRAWLVHPLRAARRSVAIRRAYV
ncbi:hypothetical protein QQX09_01800 [Demequina sp. SYSU T00192]|uniref:Uncharacterized protein n=1 Tax=Demequina litoralis TaxID=3051660 RepID=A0ABT8G613_9MICO|nr:hypothetical protein [Demequina sp. SYSU T00192]MDN4474580.1 hypothetical protein [Demequina sp. SYSU T00192]